MTVTLRLAQDPDADALLSRSPLAALIGMLLDQQVPMEWAFAALLSAKPAVHRYPGSMAKRVQQLCQYLDEHYAGDASAVWQDAGSGTELLARLVELPGFGKQKAQIFLALLGKQFGVRPKGWREAAGPYGEPNSFRSVADITGPESLDRVRAHKQEAKRAAKAAKEAAAQESAG